MKHPQAYFSCKVMLTIFLSMLLSACFSSGSGNGTQGQGSKTPQAPQLDDGTFDSSSFDQAKFTQ